MWLDGPSRKAPTTPAWESARFDIASSLAPILLAVALLSGGFAFSRLPVVGAFLPEIGPRFPALAAAVALALWQSRGRPSAPVSAWTEMALVLAPMAALFAQALVVSGAPEAGWMRPEHIDLFFLVALALAAFFVLRTKRNFDIFLHAIIALVAISDLFKVMRLSQPEQFYTSVTVALLNIMAAYAALRLFLAREAGWGAAYLIVAGLFLAFAALSGAKIAIAAVALSVAYLLFRQAAQGNVRVAGVVSLALFAIAMAAVASGGPEYMEGRFRRALDVQYGYTEGAGCAHLFPGMTESRDLSCLTVTDTTERLRLWAHALWVFKQKPLFGQGADAYRVSIETNYRSQTTQYIYEYDYPHNIALEALAKYGLSGLLLLAVSLLFAAYAVSRQVWLRPEAAAFAAMIVGLLTVSVFSGSIADYRAIWLFAVAAIVDGANARTGATHGV